MRIERGIGVAVAAVVATAGLTGTAVADRGGAPNDNASPNAQGAPSPPPGPPPHAQAPAQPPARGQASPPRRATPAPGSRGRSQSAPGHTGQTPVRRRAGSPPAAPRRGSANRGNSETAHRRVTICHRTGSERNPYVEITISEAGLNGHRDGHDGDIVPAPAGGCPSDPPAAQASGTGDPGTTAGEAGSSSGRVLGASARSGATDELLPIGDLPGSAVLSATAASDAPGGDQASAAAAPQARERLPFTGLEALIVALVGSLALAAGLALYRLTSPTR